MPRLHPIEDYRNFGIDVGHDAEVAVVLDLMNAGHGESLFHSVLRTPHQR